MSGINFLYNNLSATATLSLTSGTANAQFPLDNLKNPSTVIKFRSTGNTAVIVFDLLQTRQLDAVGIVGDATDQFGITAASIKTSVTNDFSLSTQIDIDLSVEQNMGYVFFSEVSHRYVELTLTGNGSYAELGNVFIGRRTNLPQNSVSIGSFGYGYSDNSDVSSNRYEQRFIDELPLVKTLSGTIEFCTKEETETLDDMFIQVGRHEPLWVILDQDSDAMNGGQFRLTIYGYLTRMPAWSAAGGQLYNASINLEQVV